MVESELYDRKREEETDIQTDKRTEGLYIACE